MISPIRSTCRIPTLVAILAAAFAPAQLAAAEPEKNAAEGIITFQIEGAEPGDSVRGIQPAPGETEAELNKRLLESFGEKPYGTPESSTERARRQEMRDRITREAREELLFKLEARALKRSIEDR